MDSGMEVPGSGTGSASGAIHGLPNVLPSTSSVSAAELVAAAAAQAASSGIGLPGPHPDVEKFVRALNACQPLRPGQGQRVREELARKRITSGTTLSSKLVRDSWEEVYKGALFMDGPEGEMDFGLAAGLCSVASAWAEQLKIATVQLVLGGTGPVGAGAGGGVVHENSSATSSPKGKEKEIRSGLFSLPDLDGVEWSTAQKQGFPERIRLLQHFLRICTPARLRAMLGPDLVLDDKALLASIDKMYVESLGGHTVPLAWVELDLFPAVREWEVYKDEGKRRAFLAFDPQWKNPRLFSLADFLSRDAQRGFYYGSLVPSDYNFRALLTTAVTNMTVALRLFFGDGDYLHAITGFRSVLERNADMTMIPKVYLFHLANFAMYRVMYAFRRNERGEKGEDLRGALALARELHIEFGGLAKKITLLKVTEYKAIVHPVVDYPTSTKGPAASAVADDNDDDETGAAGGSGNRKRAGGAGSAKPKGKKNKHDPPLTPVKGGGGGYQGGRSPVKGRPLESCPFHLMGLLCLKTPAGAKRPIPKGCKKPAASCQLGPHPTSLKMVDRAEARRCALELADDFKAAVIRATNDLPKGSFKSE